MHDKSETVILGKAQGTLHRDLVLKNCIPWLEILQLF